MIMKILITVNLCPYAGPIWLDQVECYSADRFEDCAHRGWGVHSCTSSQNIGLVCDPGSSGNSVCSIRSCVGD